MSREESDPELQCQSKFSDAMEQTFNEQHSIALA
jgi:hypothetical protein